MTWFFKKIWKNSYMQRILKYIFENFWEFFRRRIWKEKKYSNFQIDISTVNRYRTVPKKISKTLTKILIFTSKWTTFFVKNSQDFAVKVRHKIIPNDYTLISLDVVSLFTNIPLSLVKKTYGNVGLLSNNTPPFP